MRVTNLVRVVVKNRIFVDCLLPSRTAECWGFINEDSGNWHPVVPNKSDRDATFRYPCQLIESVSNSSPQSTAADPRGVLLMSGYIPFYYGT
jgi:hypothetical protein